MGALGPPPSQSLTTGHPSKTFFCRIKDQIHGLGSEPLWKQNFFLLIFQTWKHFGATVKQEVGLRSLFISNGNIPFCEFPCTATAGLFTKEGAPGGRGLSCVPRTPTEYLARVFSLYFGEAGALSPSCIPHAVFSAAGSPRTSCVSGGSSSVDLSMNLQVVIEHHGAAKYKWGS